MPEVPRGLFYFQTVSPGGGLLRSVAHVVMAAGTGDFVCLLATDEGAGNRPMAADTVFLDVTVGLCSSSQDLNIFKGEGC